LKKAEEAEKLKVAEAKAKEAAAKASTGESITALLTCSLGAKP
jgi:hypothetical protein